jgi:hypothetical protein
MRASKARDMVALVQLSFCCKNARIHYMHDHAYITYTRRAELDALQSNVPLLPANVNLPANVSGNVQPGGNLESNAENSEGMYL